MDIEKELRENPKAFEKVDYETYKEHVIVRNDSYRPFSNEWKEGLMELTKEQLIEQLKNNIIENMQLKDNQRKQFDEAIDKCIEIVKKQLDGSIEQGTPKDLEEFLDGARSNMKLIIRDLEALKGGQVDLLCYGLK